MQVEASVDEADIGNIKLGQKVEFSVDAYPNDKFFGEVKQIRLQPIATQNVVTYTVIIYVNNENQKLLPGMTANINVIIEKHENVLKVPSAALRFEPDYEMLQEQMKQLPDSIKEKMKKRKEGRGQGRGGSGFKKDGAMGSKGKVWVKRGELIMPVRVEVGLSDGASVEVKGALKEGDEVVTNASQTAKKEESSKGQENPFAPKMPKRGSGGGKR